LLEVGSGLGYLTYSLAKSGYNIRGLELSTKAVAAAQKRYGDLYDAGDLFELTRSAPGAYDVVILTEVIEHLSDPLSFLAAARGLLAPGGVILLTTPNKSLYPPTSYWQTDNPPVHLWWFSEASMRQMAIGLGMQIHFGDFTAFNAGRMFGRPAGPPDSNYCAPILDAEGGVALRGQPGRGLAARRKTAKLLGEALSDRLWTLREQARGARTFFRQRAHLAYSRSYSMGVALSN
jgi:SAM-dependent methyltransferase